MLVMLNILTLEQAIGHIAKSHTTLGLFYGVMVPFLFKKSGELNFQIWIIYRFLPFSIPRS